MQDKPDLSDLSDWAIDGRYPNESEELSQSQSQQAYSQAKDMLESIE